MIRYTRPLVALGFAGAVLIGTTACSDTSTQVIEDESIAVLQSVVPSPGSVNVTVDANVVISFDHPIGLGMEAYSVLHEGSLTGPEVEGIWELAEDRMSLIFTPAQALKPATTYFIHVGGGMRDEHGRGVNLELHGVGMGGQWATETMLSGDRGTGGWMGGQHGSQQGGQYGGQHGSMMGEGWAHATNGTYGMVFEFTTEG